MEPDHRTPNGEGSLHRQSSTAPKNMLERVTWALFHADTKMVVTTRERYETLARAAIDVICLPASHAKLYAELCDFLRHADDCEGRFKADRFCTCGAVSLLDRLEPILKAPIHRPEPSEGLAGRLPTQPDSSV